LLIEKKNVTQTPKIALNQRLWRLYSGYFWLHF